MPKPRLHVEKRERRIDRNGPSFGMEALSDYSDSQFLQTPTNCQRFRYDARTEDEDEEGW